MLDVLDIAVQFQPILSFGALPPLGWVADATVRGARYAAAAAALPPEMRSAFQAERVERTFEAAVEAGVGESGALLVVPLCAASGDPDRMLAHLFRTALRHRFPTERIVVEVSADERVDRHQATALLQACVCRGLAVGLDAFAAGPVALGLLAHFTPRLIRLDPALARRLETSPSRRRIVGSIVRLARGMDVTVVAQGLQHRAEIDAAAALGLRHFEGAWGAAALDVQPLPHPQPPRRDARTLQATHRRLAHHYRSAPTRTAPLGGAAMQAAV